MKTIAPMPRWDLSVYFPSVESSEYTSAVGEIDRLLDSCEQLFKDKGISPLENPQTDASTLRVVVDSFNDLIKFSNFVGTYTRLTVATNTSDDAGQAAISALNPRDVRLSKLGSAFTAWVGTLDLDQLLADDPSLKEYEFPLQKTKIEATHLMSSGEEALAADLAQTSSSAWSKLYGDYQSNIEVVVNGEAMPMSACRALAYDSDQSVRKAAYEAELNAWKNAEIPIAAAMNSVKGTANVLGGHRGWESQLDTTLFRCNMDRESLEAMLAAARDAFPGMRRYFQAKAKALGHTGGLPFYDLFAPVGSDQEWSVEQAQEFVEEGFRSYSDKMGDFAARSFRENWHDFPPQKGKRDGAFCASTRDGESRMLYNFKPSFSSVSTLAHELGHAYHNVCLQDRMPMQRQTPMTLAETASIFCETIIKRRALESTSGAAKLAILEASIMGASQVVVDITSRYLFETETIDRRKERELSPTELCDIMRRAQLDTYGDGLDPDFLHPYMWAAKPHYYSYMAFYNFPYMFGLLFALGLYRVYTEQPEGFHERYDDLLSSTGLYPAAELTARFGIDIRDKAFWAGSLAVILDDIDEYVALTNA